MQSLFGHSLPSLVRTAQRPSAGARRAVLAGAVAAAAALVPGCSTMRGPVADESPAESRAKATFYWTYAPLAADVYVSEGAVDAQSVLSSASPWLRREVREANDPAVQAKVDRLGERETAASLKHPFEAVCGAQARAAAAGTPTAQRLAARCKTLAANPQELQEAQDKQARLLADEPNRYVDRPPGDVSECEFRDDNEPKVPLEAAIQEFGWRRVPEFSRNTVVRGWAVFVPDLAIDVWRRQREPQHGAPTVEYAIVYRGTVGGGGWLSNFRGVTAMTPFVWDQYRQARETTRAIVRQMAQLHALSDALFDRPVDTRILVTAVGHSLGAGLASFIFNVVPEVTRVVGFDPSPVDGSSMISMERRASVMLDAAGRPRAIDTDERSPPVSDTGERAPPAAIFMLYEKGEILSRIAQCASGPVWGAEGGPRVLCEQVNFSAGSWFRQHNMAQLACKLYRAKQGQPVR